MVLDTVDQAARYTALHPRFADAFEFLARLDLAALAPGRIQIDGERLYVSIDHVVGRGREGTRLEAHRRYIDIQVTIAGTEQIGWRPLVHCREPDGPFTPDRDIGFFKDAADTWLIIPERHFVILFPDDAHAPLAGAGPVRKAVVKVEC